MKGNIDFVFTLSIEYTYYLMKYVRNTYAFLVTLLCMVQLGFGTNITSQCVDIFNCTHKGFQLVYCYNTNLRIIPVCLKNIALLDMKGNSLQSVSSRDFPKDLETLEVLILQNTLLRVVYEDAFRNLYRLRDLNLSENLIKTVTAATFSHNIVLERLNLSSNIIRKLKAKQLVSNSLREVDMSNGFLESIDMDAFSDLPKLEWLNLQDNKLKTLSLGKNIPIMLVGGTNPWNCDCSFLSLSKQVKEELDKNFNCLDIEKGRHSKNEISLIESNCEEKRPKVMEKQEKSENLSKLIPYMYAYSLLTVGFTVLVFMCCCCDSNAEKMSEKPNTREPKSPSSAVTDKEKDCVGPTMNTERQIVTDV